MQAYDRIGRSYALTRQQDPRIARAVRDALGDARSVVNVGAGAGSYEPEDRDVLAVEPSAAMIRQRPAAARPVLQARAEGLPLKDKCFDAAMVVNSVHHWNDVHRGLEELLRVTRRRIVILLRDPRQGVPFWLTERYGPELSPTAHIARIVDLIEGLLPPLRSIAVRLPRNCSDGLFCAYWGRPERYLDAAVRRNISNFALADAHTVEQAMRRLRHDLDSGEWDRQHGALRSLPELDCGHRILVAELC